MIRCWPVLHPAAHVRRTLHRRAISHAATAIVLVCAGTATGLAIPPWLAGQPYEPPFRVPSVPVGDYVPAGAAIVPTDRIAPVVPVPEPSTLAVLAIGAAGALIVRRRM